MLCFLLETHLLTQENISTNTITINAVGDVLFNERLCKLEIERFSEVKNLLQTNQPDIILCNLEGPITTLETPFEKYIKNQKKFLFKMPPQSIEILKFLGFNVITYANNHIMDYGIDGLNETKELLSKNNIFNTGSRNEYISLQINNLKVAILAFSWISYSNNYNEPSFALNLIKKAKKENDIVVISIHAGKEGENAEEIPLEEDEIFLGENRGNIYKFSKKAIDSGADLIIGHGPHILRGIEIYKNRLILYSLGNFIAPEMSLDKFKKYSAVASIVLNSRGEFVSGKIIPCIIQTNNLYGIPKYDEKKRAISKINELTEKNFPHHNVKIKLDGTIIKLE